MKQKHTMQTQFLYCPTAIAERSTYPAAMQHIIAANELAHVTQLPTHIQQALDRAYTALAEHYISTQQIVLNPGPNS
jgi:hypothetical protein